MSRETVICKYCEEEFEAWACNNRKYCSKQCSNRANAEKKKRPIYLRALEKVDIRGRNECWPYTGSTDSRGYGAVSSRDGHGAPPEKAHRVIYAMVNNGIDNPKSFILHKCDNPICVNPNHLYEGDQHDNMQDMSRRNRMNKESLLNLHPGQKGILGAGIKSKRENKTNKDV